jgi:prevent-host-death family protein
LIATGIRELKARLSSYVDVASRGEQVVITEHGKEVATIVPISEERKAVKALVDQGKAHWSGERPKGFAGIRIRGRPLSETILEERE